MGRHARIVIYEWNAWTNFLLPRIFPDAERISANSRDSADIVDQISADCKYFIFHINCTYPGRFVTSHREVGQLLLDRGISLVNSNVPDISKPFLQTCCKSLGLNTTLQEKDGDGDELLIVKTTLNSCGVGELSLTAEECEELHIPRPPKNARATRRRGYRVLKRIDIPPTIWNDSRLHIEKYISSPSDMYYRATFLMNRFSIAEVITPGRIKKFAQGVSRKFYYFDIAKNETQNQSKPLFISDLIQLRDRLGLDYGSFDIVQDSDGQFYVVDANCTPYCQHPEFYEDTMTYLQSALDN